MDAAGRGVVRSKSLAATKVSRDKRCDKRRATASGSVPYSEQNASEHAAIEHRLQTAVRGSSIPQTKRNRPLPRLPNRPKISASLQGIRFRVLGVITGRCRRPGASRSHRPISRPFMIRPTSPRRAMSAACVAAVCAEFHVPYRGRDPLTEVCTHVSDLVRRHGLRVVEVGADGKLQFVPKRFRSARTSAPVASCDRESCRRPSGRRLRRLLFGVHDTIAELCAEQASRVRIVQALTIAPPTARSEHTLLGRLL